MVSSWTTDALMALVSSSAQLTPVAGNLLQVGVLVKAVCQRLTPARQSFSGLASATSFSSSASSIATSLLLSTIPPWIDAIQEPPERISAVLCVHQ